MDETCVALWDKHYVGNLATAPLKLMMGHEAFERLGDASAFSSIISQEMKSMKTWLSADLKRDRLGDATALNSTLSREMQSLKSELSNTSTQVLGAIEASNRLEAAKSKQTVKGKVFEGDMVALLSASAGIAHASTITERDYRNKQGGDVIATDHQGNTCVIELKDKGAITQTDLDKFVTDAENWSGDSRAVFAFVVKGGIGSSRKLQERSLIEYTSTGRMLFWQKGDEASFVTHLPFVLGIAAQAHKVPASDGCTEGLSVAVKALEHTLDGVRSDIAALDKARLVLKKREIYVLDAVNNAGVRTAGSKRGRVD